LHQHAPERNKQNLLKCLVSKIHFRTTPLFFHPQNQGCLAGAQAIGDGWSQSCKFLDGAAETRAWILG